MLRLLKFGLILLVITMLVIAVWLVIPLFAGLNEGKNNLPEAGLISVNPVKLPEKIDFAGEKVPLMNFDIRESLDREMIVNVYYQSLTLLTIKRATRYFPMIEPILKKNGIPDDFKYLAVVESALTHPNSPAGAKGIWQFIESTAKEYGLEINKEVDERYNVARSTQAACDFFKESYAIYHNWTLTAASYDIGRKRLSHELERQKANTYYDLMLNDETARYIFRVLAMKTIMLDPGTYGYQLTHEDLYPFISVTEMTVDTPVTDFADFAKHYSINYKILKIFNPWLRESYLTNKAKKSYIIQIPKEAGRVYDFNYKKINTPVDTTSND
ncbi:MAG: lytic transglycosylase domain-containing protein [Bacteroidia bacterium]|nr:lytic transglycosylase domain-containing protein [Bacteroidia bacterium]